MGKKFIAIAAAILISVQFTGCHNTKSTNAETLILNNNNNETTSSVDNIFDYDKEEAFKAYTALDLDYLKENNLCLLSMEYLEKIASNPELSDFWKSTLGVYEYYPEEKIVVGPSVQAVFDMWYDDCRKNNLNIPDDITTLTLKELKEIFNTYYLKAPYVYTTLSDKIQNSSYYSSFDGNSWTISTDLDYFFVDFGVNNISYYLSTYSYSPLILGEQKLLSRGYDFIYEKIPDADKYADYVNNLTGNCIAYKGYTSLDFYVPVSTKIKNTISSSHEIYTQYTISDEASIDDFESFVDTLINEK